jgi:hypothetical protein
MFNFNFKTMRKIQILLIITLTVMVINCKKDANSVVSRKDLLSGKTWIMTAETISPAMNVNGTLITDFYSQEPSCTKDDIAKLNSNGTYTLEEGQTKCSANDPQVYETGTWTLSSDESVLVLTSNGTVTNAKIQELTASKLVVIEEETLNSIKYTLTSTYKTI